MIRWQLHLMWPLLLTLLALAAFALYVLSHVGRHYRLKLLLIPALIGAMTFSFPWLASRMGYGYPQGLPQSFEYVAHKLVIVDRRKAWLDILVVSRQPFEDDARLHRMPWSDELEQALKKAQQMQQNGGGTVHMERGEGDDYPSWMPRRVLPQDVAPKDPPPVGGRTHPPRHDLLKPQGPSI